jgi:hypothetical protein
MSLGTILLIILVIILLGGFSGFGGPVLRDRLLRWRRARPHNRNPTDLGFARQALSLGAADMALSYGVRIVFGAA